MTTDDALPRQPRIMLDYLRAHRGQLVTRDDLIRALYPDPDDEPEHPAQVVDQVLCRLRREHGISIETMRGWRLPALRSAPGAFPAGEEA